MWNLLLQFSFLDFINYKFSWQTKRNVEIFQEKKIILFDLNVWGKNPEFHILKLQSRLTNTLLGNLGTFIFWRSVDELKEMNKRDTFFFSLWFWKKTGEICIWQKCHFLHEIIYQATKKEIPTKWNLFMFVDNISWLRQRGRQCCDSDLFTFYLER